MPILSQDRTLPAAVTNLRLCAALRPFGSISVADAFDKSTAERLYVYDTTEGYSDWSTKPDCVSKCFVADNPGGSTLVLLPLDNRIVTGRNITKGGICDCLVLTEKEVSFLEFKTNVISIKDETIIQRADKAIRQLWNTYDKIVKPGCCKALQCSAMPVFVDFHVVFDQDLNVTGVSAELMDKQSEFLEEKGLPLYFDNEKTFR